MRHFSDIARYVFCGVTAVLSVGSSSCLAEDSWIPTTTMESEWATGMVQSGLQKADTRFTFEFSGDLTSHIQYTVIPKLVIAPSSRLYVDDPNENNYSSFNGPLIANDDGVLELSEAYLDFQVGSAAWRVGKQQVVWGQADGLKVLDVVNPQDYREFNLDEFDQSRIPLWMINTEFEWVAGSTLQVLLIPDTTYSKLADVGTPYEITSPKYIPAVSSLPLPVTVFPAERPDDGLEAGLRYRLFLQGWDVTFNYLYHRMDIPAIYRSVEDGRVNVLPVYEPSQLFGASASNAFGDWVIRMEAGYNTDTYHLQASLEDKGVANKAELLSVVGLDYQGWTDWFLSYQWYQSTLQDYHSDILRNRFRQQHTFLVRRSFLNETLSVELFALYSDEDQDGQVRSEVSYQVNDVWKVWLGVDVFYGDEVGQFGQFNDTDRARVGFELSF